MWGVGIGNISMKTAAEYRAFGQGKLIINERTHPYHVEFPVAAAGLYVALNRQIMEFHKSRHIQLRHGRTILRYGDTYYRWCFADLATARAFIEQFGGALCEIHLASDVTPPLPDASALTS